MVFIVSGAGSVAWDGPVANCIYAAFTVCFCGAALLMLYYYRTDRDNSHAKIAKTSTVASFMAYAFIFVFLVSSSEQQKECQEQLEWISIAKVYVTAPLVAAMFGMQYYMNWFCFLCIAAGYNYSASMQNSYTVSALMSDAVLQAAIVVIVLYTMERRDRLSFLLNVHTVHLMRNERRATREARKMTRSFSRMVSTISHDLKTPISAIQTGTNLLANIFKHEPNNASEPVLLEMKNATKIGVSFLESLCSSAALLDAGDRELEPIYNTVCIPDIIDSALGTCGLWSNTDIALTRTGNHFSRVTVVVVFVKEGTNSKTADCVCLAVQEGLEACYSSETMLVRNLLNLITNAIKHTVRGRIHVSAGFKTFGDDNDPHSLFVEFQAMFTIHSVHLRLDAYCLAGI